jgi:hypothetical protein
MFLDQFKGIGSPDGFFWKPYKIRSVLSEHAQIVFRLLALLVNQKIKCKVSAGFLENTY